MGAEPTCVSATPYPSPTGPDRRKRRATQGTDTLTLSKVPPQSAMSLRLVTTRPTYTVAASVIVSEATSVQPVGW